MRSIGNYGWDYENEKWVRKVTLYMYTWIAHSSSHTGNISRNWGAIGDG